MTRRGGGGGEAARACHRTERVCIRRDDKGRRLARLNGRVCSGCRPDRAGGDGLSTCEKPLEIGGKIAGGLIAIAGIACHRARDDVFERAAERGVHVGHPRRLRCEEALNRLEPRHVTDVERQTVRQQPIEQHTEGVDVAARVDFVRASAQLFGAHVRQRAHELTVPRMNGQPLHVGAGRARNAEVEDLRLAAFGDEHVGRFEIAVNDAAIVGVLHSVGELDDQGGARGDRQPLRAGVIGQRWTGDELHHEMRRRRAIARVERVHLRDARVLEPAEHFRFVLEPAQDLRMTKPAPEHFDRDRAARVEHVKIPEARAGLERTVGRRHIERGDERGIEEVLVGTVERGNERLDLAAESGIAAAARVEDGRAIVRCDVREGEEDHVHRGQRHGPVPDESTGPSARYNHARAKAHSFLIVAGDRSSAAAVSSTLSPAKYRSETICALRGSVCSRSVKASSTATISVSDGSARMMAESSSTRSAALPCLIRW